MVARGNQELRVRLDADVLELLKAKVPAGQRGRSGGVAHYVRQLIYRDLDLGDPPQFAAAEVPPTRRRKSTKEN